MIGYLKCFNNLGVVGFLPPPGGPHAATMLTSTMSCDRKTYTSFIDTGFETTDRSINKTTTRFLGR